MAKILNATFSSIGSPYFSSTKTYNKDLGIVCAARILNAVSSSDETSYFGSTVTYNKDLGGFCLMLRES